MSRIYIKDIKEGQRFVEQDGQSTAEFEATEDAVHLDKPQRTGWEVCGKLVKGRAPTADEDGVVTFFVADIGEAYGPKLYTEPAYIQVGAAQTRWQPLDTAPVNESVLLRIPGEDHYGPGVYRGMLVDMGTGRRWMTTCVGMGRDILERDRQPTGWMPLPALDVEVDGQ